LFPRISSIVVPANQDAPSRKTVELGRCHLVPKKSPQSKRPLGSAPRKLRRELLEPWTIDADFYDPTQDVNLSYKLITRHSPAMSTRDNKHY
jgi:hypothetical protein